jgi:phytoene desaturase
MLLAKAGLDVTVVEKRGTVGGRTSTMAVDGFRFDVGPTFFLFPQVLREIFAACGYSLEKEVPMVRLDPHYRLVFGGCGQVDATSDVERMKREIAAIAPADAARLDDYFRDNREKLKRFAPILQTAFESWRDLLRLEILGMLPLLRPWRSLDSDLRNYLRMSASGWGSVFSRSIWACRPSPARVCSAFFPFWSMSMGFFILWAGAAR